MGLAPTGVWSAPPIPDCNWRTLPSSQTPSLPALSFPLPPHPPWLFCKAPEGAAQAGGGGGVLGRKGVEGGGVLGRKGVEGGGGSKRHLGPDPHLEVLDNFGHDGIYTRRAASASRTTIPRNSRVVRSALLLHISLSLGDQSFEIAKNHPKPSQELSEQFGPSIHKMKGFDRNSPREVHPNFARNLGRQILGNTFLASALSLSLSLSLSFSRGPKKHIDFFNINFLAPTQNTPFWAPPKRFMCLISWKRAQKRDPHKLFRGTFGGQKGGPKRAIFGHKKFSLLFFSCPCFLSLSRRPFFQELKPELEPCLSVSLIAPCLVTSRVC